MMEEQIILRLGRLEGDIAELRDDVMQNKEKLIEHNVRFGNGIKVMGELKEGLQALQPKAPDWQKILLAGLSVVGILMGAQIYLQDRFDARPTRHQINQQVTPILETQKETAKEISEIEKHQSAQQTSIQNIEKAQANQEEKLDNILEKLSKGGRRSR